MHIMTAKARHAAAVHHALHKIIPLHPIFVSRAIGVMRERHLAQRMLLKLPEIPQI